MLTDELRSEIRTIFNLTEVKRTWLFDEAPSKRLNNGLSRFGHRISPNEEIILFHDSTTFGTGREGLILTTKALYWKEIFDSPKTLLLEKIVSFGRSGWLMNTTMTIKANHPNDNCRIITEHAVDFARLLNDVLPLLKNTKTEDIIMPKQDVDKNWRCIGCKAVNEVQNTHCEWCRKPKFIE